MSRAAVVAFLVAVAPHAATPQQPPVFPSHVDVVALDVSVVDGNGKPVRDLAVGEFDLTVDGKPRRVVSAEFVPQTGGADEPAVVRAPSHFSTNEGVVPGRLVLIAVDEANIPMGTGREFTRAAQQLLDHLGPADRVGLLTIPGPEPREEFTSDHSRIRAALGLVAGRGRYGSRRVSLTEAIAYDEQDDFEKWNAALARECANADVGCVRDVEAEATRVAWEYREQSRRSLSILGSAFESLGRIAGQKVVVLVSQGLGLSDAGSRPGRVTSELRELAVTAAASRVSLFVVQVRPSPGAGLEGNLSASLLDDDRALHSQALETLAILSRGAVLRGDPAPAFARIAREISGYYLIGFEAEEKDRNGKAHNVKVRVRRPGVTVRTRTTVAFPVLGDPKEEERTLVASLRAPIPATAIPVRVATYALRGDRAGKVRLLISAEIGGPSTAPEGLAVAWVLLDSRGRVAASAVQRAEGEPGREGPIPFVANPIVEPGLYTLKVSARDAMGRQGSVEHAVKAALMTAGPLELSDLMLGVPPGPGKGMRPGFGLETVGGVLVAHLELYGEPSAVDVSFEVARGEDAPSLHAQPARIATVSGRRIAQGVLQMAALAPGDYVARAVVFVSGQPMAGASHAFRVRAP
jgi:VWFA-related protein